MTNRTPDHHATLIPCRECSRLELGYRMATSEPERQRWQRLIDAHKGIKRSLLELMEARNERISR